MKTTYLTFLFLCCFPISKLAGQALYFLDVNGQPPAPNEVCISSKCNECGKLIFTSSLSDLVFISDMDNIVGKPEINRDVNADGNEIFTYKVSVKALPEQNIRVQGPINAEYILKVPEVQLGTCLHYIIKPIVNNNTSNTGSLFVKTIPPGANFTINGEPQSDEVTPYIVKDHQPGTFKVKIEKADYNPVDTSITIVAGQISELKVNLKPRYLTPPRDTLKILQDDVKKYTRKKNFWLVSTLLTAAGGGYMMYASDQKYQEYQNSSNSQATDLRKTSETYNTVGTALLGVATLCAVEFTFKTIKKGKSNDKLKLYMKGQGVKLTYNF